MISLGKKDFYGEHHDEFRNVETEIESDPKLRKTENSIPATGIFRPKPSGSFVASGSRSIIKL
jgi:hypothetical protein